MDAGDDEFLKAAIGELRRRVPLTPEKSMAVEALTAFLQIAKRFSASGSDAHYGLDAATEATRLARRMSPEALRKALTFEGVVTFMCGNAPRAIERYAEAYEIAKQLGDARAMTVNLVNVASALVELGQYAEATLVARAAARRAPDDAEGRTWKAAALSAEAFCCLQRKSYDDGLRAVTEAVSILSAATTVDEWNTLAVAQRNHVALLLHKGLAGIAGEAAARARVAASRAGTAVAAIAAEVATALVEQATGRRDIAASRIARVLSLARQVRPSLQQALVVAADIAASAGRDGEAMAYEEELVAHMQHDRANTILFHLALRLHEAGLDPVPSAPVSIEWIRQHVRRLEPFAVAAALPVDAQGKRVYRVSELVRQFSAAIGLPEPVSERFGLAARLYDIGNQMVPEHLLRHPGPLDAKQRDLVLKHAALGANLLGRSALGLALPEAEDMAQFHHAWFDGRGGHPPAQGAGIPLAAKIVAVADVFDALTHERPWRGPSAVHDALREIAARSGAQFDPQIAERFVHFVGELALERGSLDQYLERHVPEDGFVQLAARMAEDGGRV